MNNIGRHGNHWKGPRVERIIIKCSYCGIERLYLPGFLKLHPAKYCSKKCAGADKRRRVNLICSTCDGSFERRADKVKEKNYCSIKCSGEARRVDGAKWRDKERIKIYMKDYYNKNRKKINEQSINRARMNSSKRKEVTAKYRIKHKHDIYKKVKLRRLIKANGDLTRQRWIELKAQYNNSCLCCGKTEPEIKVCVDHIIPLSKGGQHTINNVQPLCVSCNSAKGTNIIDYRKIGILK